MTSEKHWQVVLSVILIIGLLWAFGLAASMCSSVLWGLDLPVATAEFWQLNAAWLTAYGTYFALFFCAAVAQITFASDNRATRLRVVMAVQHACFVGWTAWAFLAVVPESEMLLVFLSFIGLHWYAMGALMTGEAPGLSPRVKRNLPQSFLGRAFLTWFNPGPGTGYLFAVCGALGALLLVVLTVAFREVFALGMVSGRWSSGDSERLLVFGVLAVAYLTAYLGVGLLVIRLLHKFGHVVMFLGVLIQLLLVAVGWGAPWLVEMTSADDFYAGGGYSLLHITDPFWTLIHVGAGPSLPMETAALVSLVPLAAVVVFLLNLPWVVREVEHVRIAKPRRVAQEDAELAAEVAPPQPRRISPWDVVEPSSEPEFE